MANLAFYESHLKIKDVNSLCEYLCDTLINTNHTYDFFVNWEKVILNRDEFKYELALLTSLKNSKNADADLKKLLTQYSNIVKVIPLLLACRDGIMKVLDDIESEIKYKTFDFSKNKYLEDEINTIVNFTQKTGLLDVLCTMESPSDYLLGIEVGLDSNARKNRSGTFLEKMVAEVLGEFNNRNNDLIWIQQKDFKHVESYFNIEIPPSLRDRKFDNVIIYNGIPFNIETNFYSGTGSKPSEIVSSYINRSEVLSAAGWNFVWLTDGPGWRSMRNPLEVGVENIDYVINVHLLRAGLLEKIILDS